MPGLAPAAWPAAWSTLASLGGIVAGSDGARHGRVRAVPVRSSRASSTGRAGAIRRQRATMTITADVRPPALAPSVADEPEILVPRDRLVAAARALKPLPANLMRLIAITSEP